MSVTAGVKLPTTTGLVLSLDFQSKKSFVDANATSLMSSASWVAGTTGSTTGYTANETVGTENARVNDTDPFGKTSVVWETRASSDSNADGGWNGDTYLTADKTKLHRFSVWVRRTSSTSSGNFYLGLYTNGTGNVLRLSDSASETNPYWDYRATSLLVQNQWYLVVGHLFPTGYVGTTRHPDSGYYTIASGPVKVSNNVGNIPDDAKFPTDATGVLQRCYHFYCTDNTTRLQFFDPRIDVCNGNQPTINELLTRSPNVWYDNTRYGNHCVWNAKPTVSSKFFTFNGTSHYGTITNNSTLDFSNEQSIVMWMYPTGTTGRRNPWNQAYGGYGTWTDETTSNYINHYFGDTGIDSSPYANLSSATVNRNQWYMITMARNASVARSYVNTTAGQAETAHAYGQLATTSANILIGNGYAGFFEGRIGAVYAYNRYLSQTDVIQLFESTRYRYGV